MMCRWRSVRPPALFEGQDPEPRDIRDYRPEVFGREVRYSNARGQSAFVDFVPKISVVDPSDTIVLAALQLARQKYGKDLIVTGLAAFQEKAIRLAVLNGIALANPELREERASGGRKGTGTAKEPAPFPSDGIPDGETKGAVNGPEL